MTPVGNEAGHRGAAMSRYRLAARGFTLLEMLAVRNREAEPGMPAKLAGRTRPSR